MANGNNGNGMSIWRVNVPALTVIAGLTLIGGIAVNATKGAIVDRVDRNEKHIERNLEDIQKSSKQIVEIKQDLKYLIKKVDEISEDVKEHKDATGN